MKSRSLLALALVGFASISVAPRANDAPMQRPDLHAVLRKAIGGTQTPAIAAIALSGGRVKQEAVHGLRRNDGTAPALIGEVLGLLLSGDCCAMAVVISGSSKIQGDRQETWCAVAFYGNEPSARLTSETGASVLWLEVPRRDPIRESEQVACAQVAATPRLWRAAA